MRRFRRALFRIAACLSVAITLTLAWLWIASAGGYCHALAYWSEIGLSGRTERGIISLSLYRGVVTIGSHRFTMPEGGMIEPAGWRFAYRRVDPFWVYTPTFYVTKERSESMLGFEHLSIPMGSGAPSRANDYMKAVAVPAWAICIASCVLPVVWSWRELLPLVLRRRRVRRGCCVACGYDLHGSTSTTCPECGAAVAPGREAS